MVAARKRQIADVDDGLELRRVRIAPELIALRPLPRQRPRDLYAVRHIVEGEIAEVRVVGKYKVEVVHAVFEQARPRLIFEPFLPVIVPGVSEFRLRFGKALVGGKQLHVLLLHGEVTHGAEGSLVIVIAEPVDADDVKGIAELEVCRILGVMTVDELVILDFHAGNTARFDKMPAVQIVGWLVDIGEESLQRLRHREEDPVEQTDHAVLRQRILHLLLRDRVRLALAGGGRKPCGIRPFRVRRQDGVRVEPFFICFLIYEHSVLRRGRPVHQLIRLIAALVEKVDAKRLRHVTGHRHELLGGDVAGHGENNADTRRILRAAVGGVQHGGIRRDGFVIVEEGFVDAVAVQGNHGTQLNGVDLAAAAFQRTAHKTAMILRRVPLRLGHFRIFLRRLRCADGGLQPLLQSVERYRLVDPVLRLPAVSVGYGKVSHHLNLLTLGVSPCSKRACLAAAYAFSVAPRFISPR